MHRAFALALLCTTTAATRPFNVCILSKSSGFSLSVLKAIKDINSGDLSKISDQNHGIADLEVTATLYDQGSVQDTFARATACINAGADCIIGPQWSSRSTVLSSYVLHQRSIPAISFSATSAELSDGNAYPLFARTIPEDAAVSAAAIVLIRKAGWRRVAFLYPDDPYGLGLHTSSRKEAADMIDAGTLEWISAPYSHKTAEGGSEANQQELNVVLKELAAKGAKVVLFGGTSGHVTPILNAAVSAGMVGRTSGCTWIGFDGFYSADQDTLKSMRGSLRLMASGCPGGPNENPLVQSLKSVDVPALLAKHTDHSIQVDTADSVKIGTVESVGCGVGFAYDAMWLAALSFSQLAVNNDVTETCSGTCEVSETQKQRGRSYFEFILNTTFSGASGQVTLLSNGDRPGSSVAVSIENDQDDGSGSFSMQWLGEITGTGGAFELPSTIIWADGTSTLPTDGVDVAISASSDNTTIVLAITIPLVLIACAFAACALSAQMKSKRQSNKVAQLSAELTQANVRSTADLAMLSKHMPSGKLTRLLSKSTEKDMEMNKFVTKAKTTDTMLQRRHRTALLLAETLDDLSNKEQQEIKGLGDGDDQKLTKDSEALLAVLATACQTIINLNGRMSTLPALPDPSSGTGVFLGGSCNPTTWRTDIAIPSFAKHGIKYYNPQVDDWKPELVQIEAEAKADASVLLFVIDSQTRAISSIAETSEYICSGRCVVLVIKEVQPGTVIAGAEASIGECKDLNRARVYLADIAKRHGVPIFTDIAKSVDHICSAVSSGKEV